MQIHTLPLGPLGTNCYIVHNQSEALIFDPGGDSHTLINFLTENSLNPISILLTHGHFDHIGAVQDFRTYYNIPVYIHESEADWLTDGNLNGSLYFQMGEISCKPADHFLKEGTQQIGDFTFEVRHVPGHSPGGLAFIFHEDKLVIGGDSLFYQGIGRTDLPGGNQDVLLNSIHTKLFTIENSYTVYPGHGPKTTIENEKYNNPFLK